MGINLLFSLIQRGWVRTLDVHWVSTYFQSQKLQFKGREICLKKNYKVIIIA